MVIPRYYYGADFTSFEDILLKECDKIQTFKKGEYLNGTLIDYNTIYYIIEGLGQFYILHESGGRSVISLHGYGNIYPLFRDLEDGEEQFKLEANLFFQAITDMKVATFSYKKMSHLITNNSEFCHKTLRAYLKYINLLLYRITATENDNATRKICNYLFSMHYYGKQLVIGNQIFITQEDIADSIGLTRVHISRCLKQLVNDGILSLSRKAITILNLEGLLAYCSSDILPA